MCGAEEACIKKGGRGGKGRTAKPGKSAEEEGETEEWKGKGGRSVEVEVEENEAGTVWKGSREEGREGAMSVSEDVRTHSNDIGRDYLLLFALLPLLVLFQPQPQAGYSVDEIL